MSNIYTERQSTNEVVGKLEYVPDFELVNMFDISLSWALFIDQGFVCLSE